MQKIEAIKKLNETLTLVKFRNVSEEIITIEQYKIGRKNTSALLTAPNSSPRLVIYTAKGRFAEVFDVCDGARVKLADPNATKSILLLFCAYYVWHCQYLTAYLHTMQFFDFQILGISHLNNNRILKFLREIDYKLKKSTVKEM